MIDQSIAGCFVSCRDLLESEEAVQGLRAFDTTMRENRVMFSIILFQKVLNLVQQARLTVTSFPLLPCVKTVRTPPPPFYRHGSTERVSLKKRTKPGRSCVHPRNPWHPLISVLGVSSRVACASLPKSPAAT